MADSNFVRGLEPLIERVCKKHDIPLDHGKIIIYNYFKSLRSFLEDPRIPTVNIPWGEYRFSTHKMVMSISKAGKLREKGFYRPKLVAAKKKVWISVLRRFWREGCGLVTQYEWRTNKKREEMQGYLDDVVSINKQYRNAYHIKWRAAKERKAKLARANDDDKESKERTEETPGAVEINVAKGHTC